PICSFIDSSKEESIGHILEVHQNRGMRKRRSEQKLIVAGCMSQRFSKDLPSAMPEVDAFIGLDQVTKVAPIIEALFAKERGKKDAPANFIEGRSTYIPDYDTPRFRLTPKHFAYIKIAEGCNHPCTFCIIPQIRGRHRSRTVASVVAEARQLVKEGVKEINLISQDTTFFGMDTWEQRPNPRTPVDSSRGTALTTLLRELNAIEGDFWIRLLYTHPAHWSDELIKTIAECPKVARYIDIPLQHISDHMLGLMQRETSGAYIRDLIKRIRAGIPGIAVRTTFIVGFPGETEADVEELCQFIREAKFERLGVFRYSQEDGTRAAKMTEQLAPKVKEARWHQTMALQQEIAREVSKRSVGRKLRVLVEEPGVARGEADAPDIDGRVYVSKSLPVGEFVEVTINAFHDYDLLALPQGQEPVVYKVAKQAQ
ncbi:MAG: 30S ribosomal protein S12 methylthiotransferase RimO, partial [Opitutus sp.]|nr:30S ribosomal protein S12 methylthiotransferase RimO [Opitutus sp.]